MKWRAGSPDRRIFALVIWEESPRDLPFVGQYEPRVDRWFTDRPGGYPAVECIYAPIPRHPDLSEKIYFLEEAEK